MYRHIVVLLIAAVGAGRALDAERVELALLGLDEVVGAVGGLLQPPERGPTDEVVGELLFVRLDAKGSGSQ